MCYSFNYHFFVLKDRFLADYHHIGENYDVSNTVSQSANREMKPWIFDTRLNIVSYLYLRKKKGIKNLSMEIPTSTIFTRIISCLSAILAVCLTYSIFLIDVPLCHLANVYNKNYSKTSKRINFLNSKACRCLSHQVKMQYLHFRFYVNYFLLPWKIPEEISRWSMLFHN